MRGKKVYPTNFVEPESSFVATESEASPVYQVANYVHDDDEIDQDFLDQLATQGDADAMNVVSFEEDREDMFQDVPDLHQALISYQEARTKILEKKKSRGFWGPSSGKGKNKGFGKFQSKGKGSGKGNLLLRISHTHCKNCGEQGHWKAECPHKTTSQPSTDSANFVAHQNFHVVDAEPGPDQVIFEEDIEASERPRADESIENGDNNGPANGDNHNGDKAAAFSMIRRIFHGVTRALQRCIRHACPKTMPDPPIAEAFSLQHLVPQVQQFFQNRLPSRKKNESPAVECFHNRPNLGAIADEGWQFLTPEPAESLPPPGLQPSDFSNDGHPERSNEVHQEHRRSSDGVPEDVTPHPDEPDRSQSPRSGDLAQHANSLQALLENVNAQKDRIEELSRILQENRSPPRNRPSRGQRASVPGDLSDHSWEMEEEEEMIRANTRSPPTRTTRSYPAAAPATTGTTTSQPERTPNELALTSQALEMWGSKRVSWGKTHNGKRFNETYENHASHVDWIIARVNTATPAMQDFITYAKARQEMERPAQMPNRGM
eukprot:s902_g13.t1